MSVRVIHGDCIEVMAAMEPESFSAVCCDPPYEIKFMARKWDGTGVAFRPETWAAVLRVLKPGGYLVAFASTRGYHRMVCAIEDAGFVIHPMLGWLFSNGFPKATSVSKAIDRAAGAEREVLQWEGWYYGLQSLKPALEPICLAQKPFAEVTSDEIHALTGWDHWHSSQSDGEDKIVTARSLRPEVRSYRARLDKEGRELSREDLGGYKPFVLDGGTPNVLRHGCGALNIDASRVATLETYSYPNGPGGCKSGKFHYQDRADTPAESHPAGRWPANVCHDGSEEVLDAFAKFGLSKSPPVGAMGGGSNKHSIYGDFAGVPHENGHGDSGSAARFFFSAKAAQWEREGGHPTVKPVALMEWLVGLICPRGGRVLDPFCGTGSTLVACDRLGFDAIGIEQDAKTCADAEAKIKRLRARRMIGDVEKRADTPGQLGLDL